MDTGQYINKNALKLILLGIVLAVAGMVFIGGGIAYADRPAFCGSCHSMQQVYSTYKESNHKQFTCGDCHLPQQNLAVKMYVKGENGVRHTYHETMRDYPESIKVTPQATKILNDNCMRCHTSTVEKTGMGAGGQSCIKCHGGVVHGNKLSRGGVSVE